MGVHTGATRRMRLNRSYTAAMQPFLSNDFDHLLLGRIAVLRRCGLLLQAE